MADKFRFSDHDWTEMAALLVAAKKQGGHFVALEEDLDATRAVMEDCITKWQIFTSNHAAKNRDVLEGLVSNLQATERGIENFLGLKIPLNFLGQLHENFPPGLPETVLNNARLLREQVQDLLQEATERYEPERLGRQHYARNRSRDLLVTDLFWFWEDFGGQARRSTSPDGKTAGGPLVRFLTITLRAAGVSLTEAAAAKLIRKRRQIRPIFYGKPYGPIVDTWTGAVATIRLDGWPTAHCWPAFWTHSA